MPDTSFGTAGGSTGTASFDECEREPIHTPGSIQPHGALLAFDPTTHLVSHASVNLHQFLPLSGLPARGRLLDDLFGRDDARRIVGALALAGGEVVRHELVELAAVGAGERPESLTAAVHAHRGVGFVELFRTAPAGDDGDGLPLFGAVLDALRSAGDLQELLARTAVEVKRMTGMDRVMVYRFADDWTGRVVAEAHEDGMESFLDLHYPAGDIPAQARELYRRNITRFIATVDYVPVPVHPWQADHSPMALDMSHAKLRSVSPVHLQYLRNMGVQATLAMSLLVDGVLWGMVVAHHRTPASLTLRTRRACHALAISVGYMVSWFVEQERVAAQARRVQVRLRLANLLSQPSLPLASAIQACGLDLMRLVAATGGAFWHGHETAYFGRWPDGEAGRTLLQWVRSTLGRAPEDVVAVDRVEWPDGAPTASEVRGVLAVRLESFGSTGMVWLRPEMRRDVAWGGNPDQPVEVSVDEQGRRILSPRNSFACWVEQVTGRSRPWDAADRATAASFKPLSAMLMARDSLAQVTQSQGRMRALVELQSDAYFQLDEQGRVVALSRPLPTGHGPIAGQRLADLLGPGLDSAQRQVLEEALALMRPLRRHLVRVPSHVAQGESVDLVVSAEPLRDAHGLPDGWHGTVSDVTIERRAREDSERRAAAEAASEAKTRFLSQISHELRTPLNAVLGFSELLQSTPGLDQNQREWVDHIHAAGEWLLAMVSDLLDLSRIESGQPVVRCVKLDVRSVAQDCGRVTELLAREAGISLQLTQPDAPVWARADPDRLRQVLVNLVSNGIKYNRPGGEVRLTVRPTTDGRRVRIEVRDTGSGISVEQQKSLYQPFNRLGRETSKVAGSGIGLVIARHFVQAMAGELTLDSTEGQGSCFTVELDAWTDGAEP